MPTSATGGIHTLATTRHRILNAPFIAAQGYDCEKRSSMIAQVFIEDIGKLILQADGVRHIKAYGDGRYNGQHALC